MAERSIESVKRLAKRLRRALPIKHTFALELIARALKLKSLAELAFLMRENGPWFESQVTGEEFENRLVEICQQSVQERLGVEVSEIAVRSVLGTRDRQAVLDTGKGTQTPKPSNGGHARADGGAVAYIGTRFIAKADGAVAVQRLRRRAIARLAPEQGCVLRPVHSRESRPATKAGAEGLLTLPKE